MAVVVNNISIPKYQFHIGIICYLPRNVGIGLVTKNSIGASLATR